MNKVKLPDLSANALLQRDKGYYVALMERESQLLESLRTIDEQPARIAQLESQLKSMMEWNLMDISTNLKISIPCPNMST